MSEGVASSQGRGPGSGSPAYTNSFRGGLLVAICGLLLFLMTFTITSPTPFRIPTRFLDVLAIIFDPRLLSLVIGVLGVATAFGFVPVRAPQDYYGGLVLCMLATFALIASADLPGQRGFAFGPGTAPRLFAGLLLVLSAIVTVMGVSSAGPRIDKYKLRGPLFVLLAIVLGTIEVLQRMFTGVAAAAAGLVIALTAKMAEPVLKQGNILVYAVGVATFVAIGLLRWPIWWVLAVLIPLSIVIAWWSRR